MLEQLLAVGDFVTDSFLHIWPYLLITVPLAVAVQISGASKYISRAFKARPRLSILLATAVGAFSPFCSCGVIPVVAALLIGGVPLAPVMSFWIASPSMDPEIFFLSVATLGWSLAVWRLGATLVLSLSAGYVTQFIVGRGWLGEVVLRQQRAPLVEGTWALAKRGWQSIISWLAPWPAVLFRARNPILAAVDPGGSGSASVELALGSFTTSHRKSDDGPAGGCGCGTKPSFSRRLLNETWKATVMVAKFMLLAFFLGALISLYIPEEWIAGVLGRKNPWSILTAALFGVPVYTSNITALPLVSGLLTQGMNPAAALAFLIAGPTTTIPAMAAVWGLATRRVFALYVSFTLAGAVVFGYLYSLVAS